jgi:hypothetical protein
VPFWLSSGPVRDPTVFSASSVFLVSILDAGCDVLLYCLPLKVAWALIDAAVEVLFLGISNLAEETG